MRIALIGRRFDPDGGGTERDLLITARILAKAGHDVAIYAAEVRAQSKEFAVRRVGTPVLGRSLRLYWFAYSAASAARRDGADIVLSFARIVDAEVLRSGGSAHSSFVRVARQWRSGAGALTMRLSPYHRVQIGIERRGFSSARLKTAIAVSNLVRDDLIRTFGLAPHKVVTLYNGVDLERFQPQADAATRAEVRKQLGVATSAPVVAFIGNGFARKGLRFLLEAWPAVASTAHLIVVGADRSMGFYQRLARESGVGERVRFVGAEGRVERIFTAADALALPSLFEPFGNVVMEAMASGLPVMVSAACGAAETLPAEMREFIVSDPTNVEEVANRVNALINARRELAAVARAAAERFTWERYGAELLALVAKL